MKVLFQHYQTDPTTFSVEADAVRYWLADEDPNTRDNATTVDAWENMASVFYTKIGIELEEVPNEDLLWKIADKKEQDHAREARRAAAEAARHAAETA